MIKIKKEDNGKEGRFVIYENEEFAGELTYRLEGQTKLYIDHTEVDEKFGGKGLGKKLVMKAVEYARENNLKITPICTYAKKVLERDQTTHDILA